VPTPLRVPRMATPDAGCLRLAGTVLRSTNHALVEPAATVTTGRRVRVKRYPDPSLGLSVHDSPQPPRRGG
jgi:hypothetical protein